MKNIYPLLHICTYKFADKGSGIADIEIKVDKDFYIIEAKRGWILPSNKEKDGVNGIQDQCNENIG